MDYTQVIDWGYPYNQQKRSLQCCEAVESARRKNLTIKPFQSWQKKGNRVQVILECTEHKSSGKPGTSRYITVKNKKNNPERMELKKFNPILKKVTVHKEIK